MATLLLLLLMYSTLLISVLPHSLNNLPHHHHQQQLLLQFKAVVSKDGNALPDWTPLHSFCNWTGVICHSSTHSVRAISLTQMSLDGTISPVLGNLSSLRSLDLSVNNLTGTIPPQLGQLPNLWILWLNNNQLQGTIPPTLSACRSLYSLDLSFNQLHGSIPPELSLLTSLKLLVLGANSLTGTMPSSLTNLSEVNEIALSRNRLRGHIPWEIGTKLSNLVFLSLWRNQLSGTIPNSLGNCSRLQVLYLNENQLSGRVPMELGQLSSNLNSLGLQFNMIGGSIPQQIVNLTNLTLLNLGDNLFSGNIPSGIKRFCVLERLYLSRNKLGGSIPTKTPFSCPVTLEECQKLELLDLSYNKLGGRIPGEVISSLKNMQFYLNLSWNSLLGSLPQEMSKIVMAQAIDISGNQLTGVIPYSLGDCIAIEYLNLSHNAFEGLFPNRSVVTLFMGNPGLCGPKNYSLPPCPNLTQGKHSQLKKIVLSIVGTIGFVSCCFIIVILWRHKLSRRLVLPSSFLFQGLGYPKFSYQDLVIATSGFDESNLLGVGNFGSVYKGILRDGKIIAIKSLNLVNEEALKSFKRECKILGRIRHRNLIRIVSAFSYPELKGLVLEFACNGSLVKHLHPDRDVEGFCKLRLSECLSIAIDVAHGMEYLHHDCPLQIVHCDLKPSNVLLDANMTALVTDFGISRLTSTNSIDSLSTTTFAVKGSIGYIAPEYGLGGNVSIKGDVYSYGILILEMVTRKEPSDEMFVADLSLHKWVRSAFPNRLADVVNSELLRDVNENMEDDKCLISFIHVGLLCSSESPRERPSMRDVAKALESLKTSLMGDAAPSNLTATISEILEKNNPTGTLSSDSSTF
ncbi:hypothetical protein SUGI_0568640 [Cryptomeria japonica]|nr:hypothetical protein SUGI_0568640 [Cryptomeria japonica]